MDISIVVPVFNKEDYLERFFFSFSSIEKLNLNYEVIFINDGSTDRSLSVINNKIESLNISNLKFRVYSKGNGGVSSARNLGINVANGDYIWFLDSDDQFEIEKVDKTLSQIKEKKYDILIYGYTALNNDSSVKKEYLFKERLLNNDDIIDMINNHTIESIWNKIYNRCFLLDNNIFFKESIKYAEDFFFNALAFKCSSKSYFFKESIYYYYNNDNSLSKKYLSNIVELRTRIYDSYNQLFFKRGLDINSIKDIFILETYTNIILNNLNEKDSVKISITQINNTLSNVNIRKHYIHNKFSDKRMNILRVFINLGFPKLTVFLLNKLLKARSV